MASGHTTRAIAALLALAAIACGAPEAAGPGAPAPAPAEEPAPRAADETDELEALWEARQDSARMRFTEADIAFMRGMIHHHAQALEITPLAETNTTTPAIRTLAARIANAQRDEIATMEAWLRSRGLEVPEVHPTAHHEAMAAHGHAGHHRMPGMLTAEQLRELAAARGEQFDRLFLTYMIQHHRGAVVMVRELFATDRAAQDEAVFRLASDVQVDQATEIARMERMLEAVNGR